MKLFRAMRCIIRHELKTDDFPLRAWRIVRSRRLHHHHHENDRFGNSAIRPDYETSLHPEADDEDGRADASRGAGKARCQRHRLRDSVVSRPAKLAGKAFARAGRRGSIVSLGGWRLLRFTASSTPPNGRGRGRPLEVAINPSSAQ